MAEKKTIKKQTVKGNDSRQASSDSTIEQYLRANMTDYLPLRDVVFNTLRQAILRGELSPGERLMEVSLASKLGVSRTPVREAIHKLELEGLVTIRPRRGAEVARITESDLRDVLEVRRALEDLAMELCVEKITPEELAALKKANHDFSASLEGDNLTRIAACDEQFHDIIYSATHNKKLIQVIANIKEQMYRYRLEYIKDESHRPALVSEHEAIIEAIEEKAREKARELMRVHIENQEKTIIQNIQPLHA